jgi:hypothetical protein
MGHRLAVQVHLRIAVGQRQHGFLGRAVGRVSLRERAPRNDGPFWPAGRHIRPAGAQQCAIGKRPLETYAIQVTDCAVVLVLFVKQGTQDEIGLVPDCRIGVVLCFDPAGPVELVVSRIGSVALQVGDAQVVGRKGAVFLRLAEFLQDTNGWIRPFQCEIHVGSKEREIIADLVRHVSGDSFQCAKRVMILPFPKVQACEAIGGMVVERLVDRLFECCLDNASSMPMHSIIQFEVAYREVGIDGLVPEHVVALFCVTVNSLSFRMQLLERFEPLALVRVIECLAVRRRSCFLAAAHA